MSVTERPGPPGQETARSRWPTTVPGWVDLLVKLGAVFAAVFAVHQYLEARQDQRVARALDYVQQFQDPGTAVGAARQALSAEIWRNAPDIEVLREILPTLPPEEADALLAQFERTILSHPPARDGLHAVVHFFDAVEVCVASRLCDEAATVAFFRGYLETLWGNFERTITDRRSLDSDYGFGVEAMLKRARDAETEDLP